MRLSEVLSELRRQRRRIDRAIAVLEVLGQQPRERKRKPRGRKSRSGTEASRQLPSQSMERKTLAVGEVGGRARIIPFGRLRRRA
jgi:hypothetical protein